MLSTRGNKKLHTVPVIVGTSTRIIAAVAVYDQTKALEGSMASMSSSSEAEAEDKSSSKVV